MDSNIMGDHEHQHQLDQIFNGLYDFPYPVHGEVSGNKAWQCSGIHPGPLPAVGAENQQENQQAGNHSQRSNESPQTQSDGHTLLGHHGKQPPSGINRGLDRTLIQLEHVGLHAAPEAVEGEARSHGQSRPAPPTEPHMSNISQTFPVPSETATLGAKLQGRPLFNLLINSLKETLTKIPPSSEQHTNARGILFDLETLLPLYLDISQCANNLEASQPRNQNLSEQDVTSRNTVRELIGVSRNLVTRMDGLLSEYRSLREQPANIPNSTEAVAFKIQMMKGPMARCQKVLHRVSDWSMRWETTVLASVGEMIHILGGWNTAF